MEEAVVDGKGLNKQGGNVWIGTDGGSSAVAIPLREASRSKASEIIQRQLCFRKKTWNFVSCVSFQRNCNNLSSSSLLHSIFYKTLMECADRQACCPDKLPVSCKESLR